MLVFLFLCGGGSICNSGKLNCFEKFVAVFIEFFLIILYLVGGVGIGCPVGGDRDISCNGRAEIIIPGKESISRAAGCGCSNYGILLNGNTINCSSAVCIKGDFISWPTAYGYGINIRRFIVYVFGYVNGIIAYVKR